MRDVIIKLQVRMYTVYARTPMLRIKRTSKYAGPGGKSG